MAWHVFIGTNVSVVAEEQQVESAQVCRHSLRRGGASVVDFFHDIIYLKRIKHVEYFCCRFYYMQEGFSLNFSLPGQGC